MRQIFLPVKLAFKILRENVGRTLFSLLGIVIGVTAVILVLALGAGLKNYIFGQLTAFGTDIFQIEVKVPKTKHVSSGNIGGQVGGTQITTFEIEDAEQVAKLSNIKSWYAGIMSQQIVQYENKKKQAFFMGVTSGAAETDEQIKIAAGNFFSNSDDEGLKQIAVLGAGIKKYLFGESEAVGKSIKIKGQTYRVVAVLEERGLTGFFNFDDIIYVPIRSLQKKIMGVEHIQFAVFKVNDLSRIDYTMLQATDVMRAKHDIKDPDDDDFAVMSVAEGLKIVGDVLFIINVLLLALVSISLVVGGVGIMNVMYVAVTERTYEIGLRKAVGAKNHDILLQFLLEAIFLTILGGLIGVLVGTGLSKIGEVIARNYGFFLTFPVTWWAVAISFGFSAATGIIFGFYPARKASKLTPMEALRRE